MGLFRKKTNKYPHIKLGFRGEWITYTLGSKQLEIATTVINGYRIHFDSIQNEELTKEDREKVFHEVLDFFRAKVSKRPILVYATDGPNAPIWEKLCSEASELIKAVETTTFQAQEDFQYNFFKAEVERGNKIEVEGQSIETVEQFEAYWLKRNQ
ncbi:MAG TPA: hypothetical protein DCE41_23035 [Cytophagales bacterium]|nr:hypothetical protein [Cytophagales bacterium]HAA23811.1 hypothetical protein [Cytophagales bacterium]HAP59317.1 hypothetical protein [Cytophagales bacterium]